MTNITVLQGDCRDLLFELDDESVDAIITDPPYELAFMGKTWDAAGIAFTPAIWEHCYHILKPGGHLLSFGGTRTWHRLACAIEDAGFEIRDSIAWLYGSGFPKSLDVSKATDKAVGAEREILETIPDRRAGKGNVLQRSQQAEADSVNITAPATDAAKQWQGWGTALKPSFEPIIVARKPFRGTVAANVLQHGTGALNIDACRVNMSDNDRMIVDARSGADDGQRNGIYSDGVGKRETGTKFTSAPAGRWPTNVVLDDSQAAELDKQSGISNSRIAHRGELADMRGNPITGTGGYTNARGKRIAGTNTLRGYDDSGGVSRFFPTFRYTAKAPKSERPTVDGIVHPTVKPLKLMRWLVRLVTPPNGLVLDPFAGSGTTGEACILENVRCVLIENDPTYIPLIEQRLTRNQ